MFRLPLGAIMLVVLAGPLRAQSLTTGTLSGVVRDSAGQPIPDASVALVDEVTGARRARMTPRNGTFRFTLLTPAGYHLLVERFGYRPRLMVRADVQAGAELNTVVTLAAASGEAGIDTVAFAGVPMRGLSVSLERGASRDFASLADSLGMLTATGLLLPSGDGLGGAAGLPGRFGALGMDGVPHRSARHARLASSQVDALSFPAIMVRGVELLTRGLDPEWQGGGGGLLTGVTRPGTRQFSVMLEALGGPDLQTASLLLGGPVMRDTANFALGVHFARSRPQLPAPWSDSLGAKVASIAQDSFNTSLAAHTSPIEPGADVLTGFARFDWAVVPQHRLGLRVSAGRATLDLPLLDPAVPLTPGSALTASQLTAAASLSSTIGRVASELRLSMDAGRREFEGATLPRTFFTEGGLTAGTSDLAPGIFKRTTLRLAETVHSRVAAVVLKGGFEVSTTSHDHQYRDNAGGTFFFGDTTGFASGNGAFTQTVGTTPIATFRTNDLGVFAQALLSLTPAFEVRAGLRYDVRTIPTDAIPVNSQWVGLTGISNTGAPTLHPVIAPRMGFTLAAGARRAWRIEGDAGIAAEENDPAILAEAITNAGGISMRRAVGSIGTWPGVPDSTIAPVRGRMLTLLGQSYRLPRSARVALGITGSLGATLVSLQGLYRHTDFLPVRRDLNLTRNPSARDQYGRPLFGTLARSGTLLSATPGSNRRFNGFDAVTSLDPAGASDYLGLSIELRRNLGSGLDLMLLYTFSKTTDNWFGARSGSAEATLVPFPDSVGEGSWIDGTSDFDVPHRLVVGAQARLGGRLGPRIGVMYRYQSGYPFTPGFRDGVDANADGSGRNDPAFVTDTVSGAATLVAATSCLRGQAGGLARRNSCRGPAMGSLDITFGLALWSRGGRSAELTADVIGAIRSGQELSDRALYLVDAAAPMTTSPAGVTSVPLVANPRFGAALASQDPGAIVRVGLRVGL